MQMIEQLSVAGILTLDRLPGGGVRLQPPAMHFFYRDLTREELRQLADELMILATTEDEVSEWPLPPTQRR